MFTVVYISELNCTLAFTMYPSTNTVINLIKILFSIPTQPKDEVFTPKHVLGSDYNLLEQLKYLYFLLLIISLVSEHSENKF